MSSNVVWVTHGCLGVAVSAGTCVVHACCTASRSFVQEASTVLVGWFRGRRCVLESAWSWGCGMASPRCEVSGLASKASCTALLKAWTTSSVAERSRFGVGGLRFEGLGAEVGLDLYQEVVRVEGRALDCLHVSDHVALLYSCNHVVELHFVAVWSDVRDALPVRFLHPALR